MRVIVIYHLGTYRRERRVRGKRRDPIPAPEPVQAPDVTGTAADVRAGRIAAAGPAGLDAHPAAKLVALVSPSYFGVAADLPAICAAAHARGVPVYVDEAWGPHLPFHPDLPCPAMAAGADGAVTSTHKMLSSLSQSSLLLVRGGRVAASRVASAVKLTQTTSPLLPLLVSI